MRQNHHELDSCVPLKHRYTIVLGTPLGHQVTKDDFANKGSAGMQQCAEDVPSSKLSFTERLLTANLFLLPMLSYRARCILLSLQTVSKVKDLVLRFAIPARFCSSQALVHVTNFLKFVHGVRDVLADIIAALLTTASQMQRCGHITKHMLDVWSLQTNLVSRTEISANARPLTNFAIAYIPCFIPSL